MAADRPHAGSVFPHRWHPGECYARDDGDLIRIGNGLVERVLSLQGGVLRTVELANKRTGRRWDVDTRAETRLTFAAADWRSDVVEWRYTPGSRDPVPPAEDAGFRQGYFRPDLDDRSWQTVECLTAVGEGFWDRCDPVWPGFGWFRTPFRLPAEGSGMPIYLGLGGYDHEDWQRYRVFVNGHEVGQRELTGRWREPSPFVVPPDHPAYAALRFGGDNLLAIQAGGLDKRLPEMRPGELEHYLFRSRLVDQFVAVGVPTLDVSAFQLRDWAFGGDRDWLWTTFWAENDEARIEVVYHYQVRTADPVMRKRIEIRNRGDAPRMLLDIDVDDFHLNGATTAGGQGVPILVDDEAFSAIEHPAGVNQGLGDGFRLRHFPGVTLTPGQGTRSKVAIFGVGEAGQGREAFHAYLRANGRRKDELVTIYDPLGLVDYCNPKDRLFHITEQIAHDTVEMLETLQTRGISFDQYIIDVGWQDHFSDLTWFKAENFPNGPGELVRRLESLGTRFGLWFATMLARWSCGDYPPVQGCLVPNSPAGQSHDRNLCPAAEPYRSVLRNAVLHHVRHNHLRAVKLDTARFYCNSAAHGHLPGKYSIEAMMESMVETARAVTRACPELFLIWYWGYSSPFWLLYGDTMFDKGLRMEAAAVASSPNPSFRSSISLNLDQAARHAELIPLIAQDSLGIWIGDVIWANRVGKDDWRDAWLLDVARGNLVSQLWGDLTAFDDGDVAFLAEWQAFLRENWRLFLTTRPILGDPWKAEVYGYVASDGGHAVLTLNNPGFAAARARLSLDERLGLRPGNRGLLVRQRHPRRVMVTPPGERVGFGETLELPLRPFEVVVLEVGDELDPAGWPRWSPPEVVDSLPVDVPMKPTAPEEVSPALTPPARPDARGFAPRAARGELPIPSDLGPRTLALVVRLSRGGEHWYHQAINELIRLRAAVGERQLPHETVPRHACFNGPGSPWLLFKIPLAPGQAGQTAHVELVGLLPEDVAWRTEGWLYHDWWTARPG